MMYSPLALLLLSAACTAAAHPWSQLLDQDFGLSLFPERMLMPRYFYNWPSSTHARYHQDIEPCLTKFLWQQANGKGNDISSVSLDKDVFRVRCDVHEFKPEEVNLKVVDNYIVIEAKHKEKKDEHGLISRQLVRKYTIPENALAEQITSTMSSDGVLIVEAPVKPIKERTIEIKQTGEPAVKKTKEAKEEAKEDEEVTITTVVPEDSTTVKN